MVTSTSYRELREKYCEATPWMTLLSDIIKKDFVREDVLIRLIRKEEYFPTTFPSNRGTQLVTKFDDLVVSSLFVEKKKAQKAVVPTFRLRER